MLVTLWTTKGEQIDLNLREDVTIGELKRTLINEFAYQNNVQLMYSSRICQDDSAVDDYPPGTLIVLGTRQAQQQQQQAPTVYGGGYNASPVPSHNTPGVGGYNPYVTHQSSGGSTLRTGHAGGMRAATEKKYANDYNEASQQSRGGAQGQPQTNGGYAQQYQQRQQQQPANQFQPSYPQQVPQQQFQQPPAQPQYQQQQQPQHRQQQYQQQQPVPQQQQFYAQQPQQQQQSPAGSNYANYVNNAATRGMQMPQQQGSGWGGNAGHMDGFASPGNNNDSPASQSAYGTKSAFAQQPPNVYGTNPAMSPQKSSASDPMGGQPSVASSGSSNNRTATPSRQEPQQRPIFSPSSQTTSQTQEEPAPYFPPVTLTATIVGQGEEKELTFEIDGAATVGDLVTLLAERAPEVGATIRPSKDSVKLMFFAKYLHNWQDPIRKVPLSSGSKLIVCTGQYVNEQLMTLHSAERAIAQVTKEAKAATAAGEMSADRKNLMIETLMKAVFALDSLQEVEDDVRARRKALVKEVNKLLDDLTEGRI